MFSVYGETGRLFKGAMEELRHVESVKAVSRARAVDPSPQETPPAAAHAGHVNPLSAYVQAASVQPRRRPLTRVAEVMSRGVITVPAEMLVLAAWQLLDRQGISQAPVIDTRGQLVGLLSRAELLRPDRLSLPDTNLPAWHAMLAQPVSGIMHSPVPAVDEDTDIRRVARVLLDTHLPGLPVVNDGGAVTGFVSRTDILRAVVHDPPLDLWS